MTVYFGGIALGTHYTGPTADAETYENEFAEHATAAGKPPLQEIGEKRDTRTFSFFFDESFCNVEEEWGRLLAVYRSKSPRALIVPGAAWRGQRYVVNKLTKTTQATTANGQLVRIEATIELSEDPRSGAASTIAGVFAGAVAEVGRAVRNIDRLR